MLLKVVVSSAIALGAASICDADASCDPAQLEGLQRSERIVASLRPDKPGQARVFAIDGSEFTAGQSAWMRGQLSRSKRACARGEAAEAAALLAELQELIKAHARP
jgi:hypothetical protein